ncbi:MAG: hypothetical protein MI724_11580 [Spirochaetales bacterium]|nr:hypothetical protein [Spirochaetales bacterium]
MKLKAIFIVFNILICVSFLFVFLMPAFFLGWDYTQVFWSNNWYLTLLFAFVLAVLNFYFARNWRLFVSLEEEDWERVIVILEDRVFRRRRYSRGNLRLLVNAYVVNSRGESISRIEEELRRNRPQALRRNALMLGIPHLLSNDGEQMERYYAEFVDSASSRDADWLRWHHAFALMLQQKLPAAREILEDLCSRLKPGILLGVSAYLLDSYGRSASEAADVVEGARQRIAADMTRKEWRKRVDGERNELHVLVLSKFLRHVEDWLYPKTETSGRTD